MSQIVGLHLHFPLLSAGEVQAKVKVQVQYSAAGDGGSYNVTAIRVSRHSLLVIREPALDYD